MREIVIIGIYCALNFLAAFLIDRWFCKCSEKYKNSVARRTIVSFLYLAVAFVPILATLSDESSAKFMALKLSYNWLGFFMFFGTFLVILTIIDLLIMLIIFLWKRVRNDGKHTDPEVFERRKARRRVYATLSFILIVIVAIGINVYGHIHARDTVLTKYEVKIEKDAELKNPMRIAFISDLHLEYNSSKDMMKRVVKMINKEKPDVVLIGGDLFSSTFYAVPDPDDYSKILSKIKARLGVYFVYGNHDVEEPLFCGFALEDPKGALHTKEMKRFIKKSGFTILEDKAVPLAAGKVQLIGRKDGEKAGDGTNKRMAPSELMENVDTNKPVVVLEHEPVEYKELAEAGADFVISGHTHAGQVFPGTIVTELINDFIYGHSVRYGMDVIVSSGLGFYGAPLRIGTNSEVVIVDLTFNDQ